MTTPTPININPGGSGACGEPCDMCCTLHSTQKTFTRLRNGSPVTVSCTKLWWNCRCNGNMLVMQRETSLNVWVDLESAWFSPSSNWWYPPPRRTARRYRIKCVLDNGFTYFSNPVNVAATWQCHCDDGTSLRRYRIDIDGHFTPAPGAPFPYNSPYDWSVSMFPGAGIEGVNQEIDVGIAGVFSVMDASFDPSPMPTNFVNVILWGGWLPSSPERIAVGEWRLDLGLGNPCAQVAPCLAGPMSFCSSCPNVTSNQQYWAVAGGSYLGYSEIQSVNAVLVQCT